MVPSWVVALKQNVVAFVVVTIVVAIVVTMLIQEQKTVALPGAQRHSTEWHLSQKSTEC
jgi:preprotein translocase subunit SecG